MKSVGIWVLGIGRSIASFVLRILLFIIGSVFRFLAEILKKIGDEIITLAP